MTVTTVFGVLVFVVVLAVTELILQLCIKSVLHKLGYGFLEQILNVRHAADVRYLQQLADFCSAFIFFQGSVSS